MTFWILHFLNRASWYKYVKKTNRMHLYLINLFQLNFPLHVSNKQVHRQEVISVPAAYSISHAWMGCPAVNTIWLELFFHSNNIMLPAGHHIDAWGVLYAGGTEITAWWWTCLFETCRGKFNWNKLMSKRTGLEWDPRDSRYWHRRLPGE